MEHLLTEKAVRIAEVEHDVEVISVRVFEQIGGPTIRVREQGARA